MSVGILLNDLLIIDIPHLAEILWVLITIIIGPIVTLGRHWGKVITNWEFLPFWRMVVLSLGEIVAWVYVDDYTVPLIEGVLRANSNYLTGITSAAVGCWFVWFVDGFGYSFKTQNKWLFAAVCFGITGLNIVLMR